MRTHYFTLLLILICNSTVFAAGEKLPYKSDVLIDGMNIEWNSPLPKFDKKTNINYSIANDEKALYFILRISDEGTQRQIMQNGLEVWINKDGKKKKVTGVTFPLPMTRKAGEDRKGQEMQEKEQKDSGQAPARGQKRPLPNNELILTGFLLENGKQPTKTCPVKVAISRDDSNCMVYELAIPFNTFYKERLEESDATLKCCFAFVVKGPKTNDSQGMGGQFGMGGMGGPGGMDGRPGGMGGPGMEFMGGQSGTTVATVTEKIFWITALLNIK